MHRRCRHRCLVPIRSFRIAYPLQCGKGYKYIVAVTDVHGSDVYNSKSECKPNDTVSFVYGLLIVLALCVDIISVHIEFSWAHFINNFSLCHNV